jgi:phage terminase large subunit GpA-like protein
MEREYVISSEESAEPGRYSFGRYEFLRAVFDWFADPEIEMVVLPKAAQIGWTTGFTGFVGSLIATDPCRILVVMPTQDEAEIWSKDRLEPNLSATPALRGRFSPAKSRDGNNRVLHKKIRGGALKIVGANSSTGLSSWPAKYALADEVDRYPLSAGGEGDPIALIRKRLQTWLRRGGKIGLGSTPKIEQTSIIWHYFELGDQQRRFVPCRHCDEWHAMEWENLRWEPDRPGTAAYYCPHCGVAWSDLDRLVAIARGQWRPTATPRDPRIRSGWIDGFLSPHVTHVELATQWLACETDEQRQAFVNLYLGRPWKVRGDAPEWQRLYDRRENWPANIVPAGVLFLTAGCDVQGGANARLEVRIWGWGRDKQSWLIETVVIPGDPGRPEVWARLDELIGRSWQHESGAEMKLARLAIDSGYATRDVEAWARRHGSHVMVVKGDNRGSSVVRAPSLDTTSGGKRRKGGLRPWMVPVSALKAQTYSWLRLEASVAGQAYPSGYIHLSTYCSDDEIKQLTAEQQVRVLKKGGFPVLEWQIIPGRRNEGLDCRSYSHAAAIAFGLDRFTPRQWDALAAPLRVEALPEAASQKGKNIKGEEAAGEVENRAEKAEVFPPAPRVSPPLSPRAKRRVIRSSFV